MYLNKIQLKSYKFTHSDIEAYFMLLTLSTTVTQLLRWQTIVERVRKIKTQRSDWSTQCYLLFIACECQKW